MERVSSGWPRRGGSLALASTLLLAVAACGGGGEAALTGVVREPPLVVGSVQLVSAYGGEVTMTAPDAELLVAAFGYTYCPDICPTTLNDLSIAVNDLPDELADRVTVAFVTVDPERDTPDVLTGYVGAFFADGGIGLHAADADQLAVATDAFGVQFSVADHEPGATDYAVAHTAVTYVIDDTGTVVVEWPFGSATEDMTADLKTLLHRTSTT